MTTYATQTRVRHETAAHFQEWVQEFHDALVAIGLTQTADTGQIVIGSIGAPVINTDAGYEIWRFNDTAQATSPIFFKIWYGTQNPATEPEINMEVGTGSDGSGNITGAIMSTTIILGQQAGTTDTTYQSYWCYNATLGVFNVIWKHDWSGGGSFIIARTCDNTGVADTRGVLISSASVGSGSAVRAHEFATSTNWSSGTFTSCPHVCAYGGVGNVIDSSGDNIAYLHFAAVPRPLPLNTMCTLATALLTVGTTFTTTLIGATARTYMPTGDNHSSSVGGYMTAFLYE